MGSVTCGTGTTGSRAWSISPKKPAYLNQPSSASPSTTASVMPSRRVPARCAGPASSPPT